MADRVRGTLPFDAAGKGVVIRFRNSDLLSLQEYVVSCFSDEDEKDVRVDWVQRVVNWGIAGDVSHLDRLLELAAKKDGEKVKVEMDDVDEKEHLGETFQRLVDGVMLAMFGKTFAEQVEENKEELERIAAERLAGANGEDHNADPPGLTPPTGLTS